MVAHANIIPANTEKASSASASSLKANPESRETKLDEALEQTFPASDPLAIGDYRNAPQILEEIERYSKLVTQSESERKKKQSPVNPESS